MENDDLQEFDYNSIPDNPTNGNFVTPETISENPYDALEDKPVTGKLSPVQETAKLGPIPDNEFMKLMKHISNNTTKGVAGLYQGGIGMASMADPSMTPEKMKAAANVEAFKEAQVGSDQYVKEHGYWHVGSMLGASAEMLPQMGANMLGGMAGGAAAGALGAVAIGTAFPPLTLLPEELVTVPVFAGLGAIAGAFITSAAPMTGQSFFKLHAEMGIDRNRATHMAAASGVAQGTLDVLGLGMEARGIVNGVKIAANTPGVKQMIGKQIANFAKTFGAELTTEVAQQVADSAITYAASYDKLDAKGRRLYDLKNIVDELGQTAAGTAQGLPGIMLFGGAASHATGSWAKNVKARLAEQTAEIDRHVAETAAKEREAIRQAQEIRALEDQAKADKAQASEDAQKAKDQADAAIHPSDRLKAVEHKIAIVEDHINEQPRDADVTEAEAELRGLRKEKTAAKKALRAFNLKAIKTEQGYVAQERDFLMQKGKDLQIDLTNAEIALANRLDSMAKLDVEIALKKDEESAVMQAGLDASEITQEIADMSKVRRKLGKNIQKDKDAAIKMGLQVKRIARDIGYAHGKVEAIQAKLDEHEAAAKKELIADIESKIKRGMKTTMSGGTKVSRYPGTQDIIMSVANFWKNPEEVKKAQDAFDTNNAEGGAFDTKGEAKPFNENAERDGIIANALFSKPRKKMTSEDLAKIDDILASAMKEGKSILADILIEKNERRQRYIDIAIKKGTEILNAGPLSTKQEKTRSEKLKSISDKWWNNTVSFDGLNFRGLNLEPGDIFNTIELAHDEQADAQKWTARLNELILEETKGIPPLDVWDTIAKGDVEINLGPVTYKTEDGANGMVDLHLTNNQAMQLALHYRDKELEGRLRTGGYKIPGDSGVGLKGLTFQGDVTVGSSVEEVLNNHLKTIPAAEGIIKANQRLYQEYFPEVSKYIYERTGFELEQNETYGGTAGAELDRDSYLSGQKQRVSARSGNLNLREENATQPIILQPWNKKIVSHLELTAHAKVFKDFEGDAYALYQNPQVKELMAKNAGTEINRVMAKNIDDMIRGFYKMYTAQSTAAENMRSNAYGVYLTGNPNQYFKQLTGMINARMFVTQEEYNDGLQDFILNYDHAVEVMNSSPLLKNRAAMLDRDYKPSLSAYKAMNLLSKKPDWKTFTTWREALGFGMQMGDLHAIHAGFWSVYRAELAKTGSEKKAMLAFEKAFETTQSSSLISELPGWFRGTGMEKFVTLFKQQPTRIVEHMHTDYLRWQRSIGTKDEAANKARFYNTVKVAFTAEAAFRSVAMLTSLPFASDDVERAHAVHGFVAQSLVGPTGGLPMIGGMIQATSTVITNIATGDNMRVFDEKFLPYDVANSLGQMAVKTGKIVSGEGDLNDIIKLARLGAKAYGLAAPKDMGGGIPWEAPLKVLDKLVPDDL